MIYVEGAVAEAEEDYSSFQSRLLALSKVRPDEAIFVLLVGLDSINKPLWAEPIDEHVPYVLGNCRNPL